jgi:hypothetical protein
MKNLLAIFLATALLVGCGTEPEPEPEPFDFASFIEWCEVNKNHDEVECGLVSMTVEVYILSSSANSEECILSTAKEWLKSTKYSELLLLFAHIETKCSVD